jgi:hypothetical protein
MLESPVILPSGPPSSPAHVPLSLHDEKLLTPHPYANAATPVATTPRTVHEIQTRIRPSSQHSIGRS